MIMGERIRSLARRSWERSREEAAFSITELLVATLLLFVITFAIINFADQGVSLASASVASAEANQEWREAIETMTRQIRVAYYFVPNQCTASALGFCSYAKGDATKYKILYRLTGTNLDWLRGFRAWLSRTTTRQERF
jgi:type II secretory pathway component PulJ